MKNRFFFTLNVFFYQYGNEAELHSRYHGIYAAKSFTYILSRFNIEADFAKISSRNLPTLLIGSLNPFQHLESPNFSQCSELRRKKPVFFQVVESCLLLVKILFFRCHQKFHIHKARVPAWQEFLRYWKRVENV